MKNTLCASAVSLAVVLAITPASAGNYVEPVIEPDIIIKETVKTGGSDDWVVPFMTLITIGMAILK